MKDRIWNLESDRYKEKWSNFGIWKVIGIRGSEVILEFGK